MILIHRKFGLFKSVRILLQRETLEQILKFSKWDYVTVVSYNPLPELEKAGFVLTTKNIANIYLGERKSDEEILASFSRNTRNEIHRTETIQELRFMIHEGYKK